jgi:TonB family protein
MDYPIIKCGKLIFAVLFLCGSTAYGATSDQTAAANTPHEKHPSTEVTPIKEVAPHYPICALKNKITGLVTIAFTVDRQGRVQDEHVIDAHPAKLFNDAALYALSQWRFNPTMDHGKPVKRRATQAFKFQLGTAHKKKGEAKGKRS